MANQSGTYGKTSVPDASHVADLLVELSLNDQNTRDSEGSSLNDQITHDSEMIDGDTELPPPGPGVVRLTRAFMDVVDRTLAMTPPGGSAQLAADFHDRVDQLSGMINSALPVLRAADSSPWDSSPEEAVDPTEDTAPQDTQIIGPVLHERDTVIEDFYEAPWDILEYIVTAITRRGIPIEDVARDLAQQHGIHIGRKVMVEIARGIRSTLESALFSNRPDLATNDAVLSIEAVQNLPRAWQQVFEHFHQLLPNSQGNDSLIEAWANCDTVVQAYIRTSTTSTDAAA